MSIVRKPSPLLVELAKVGVAGLIFMVVALLVVVGPDFLLPDVLTQAGLG
ncbi:hypothetical protein J2D73_10775 [Acetobacter sacchari]|uniref:ABC transporter permease n=1 Tax=Acetobacter sacchari TaxID=2661687 RepID=A0ABS3LWH2_9PROT|nr:hypothetical protein [Acetobacter sacchari]MBO1360270.1 hypothetical protein [Acetobacter sacchari]